MHLTSIIIVYIIKQNIFIVTWLEAKPWVTQSLENFDHQASLFKYFIFMTHIRWHVSFIHDLLS
jgi:hypothetical protein